MNNALFFCLIAGFCFGTWPLVAKYSNLNAFWVAFLVPLGTTIFISLVALPKLSNTSSLTTKAVAICLIAGVLNGIGILAYGKIISNTNWDISKYVSTTAILMICFTAIGALFMFKEPFTTQKTIGFLFAVAAVWLLS